MSRNKYSFYHLIYYVYIQIDEINIDTYINHIYQIWYESINYLKQVLNWDGGIIVFFHNVKLEPTARLPQLQIIVGRRGATEHERKKKTKRGPGAVAACSRLPNQAN